MIVEASYVAITRAGSSPAFHMINCLKGIPMKKLPNILPREAILAAAHAYDAGVNHAFADSRDYDVIINDRRYPPKAIVGLAASAHTGLTFTPADFSGGIKSKCVRLLTDKGFQIVNKSERIAPNLFPDEIQQEATYIEGAAVQVTVNRYEPPSRARLAWLSVQSIRSRHDKGVRRNREGLHLCPSPYPFIRNKRELSG